MSGPRVLVPDFGGGAARSPFETHAPTERTRGHVRRALDTAERTDHA